MKKSKKIILGVFFSALVFSCSNPQDYRTPTEDQEIRTDNNGNNFVYYAGLWYLLNSRGQFSPSSNGFRMNGNSFVQVKKEEKNSSARGSVGSGFRAMGADNSSAETNGVKTGGFGRTAKMSSSSGVAS